MNRNFLIAVIATVLGLLMASSTFATETRINSLGGQEKQFTIRDQSTSFVLPQVLLFYGNQVDVDAANGADYGTMNIRYKLTDDAVLSLYGKRPKQVPLATLGGLFPIGPPPAKSNNSAGSISGYSGRGGPIEDTSQQFGVGFAALVGESTRLGAALELGGRRDDEAAGSNENNNLYFSLNLGLGLDLNETNNLDFGLKFTYGSFTDVRIAPTKAALEHHLPNGIFALDLLAKGDFQVHQIAKIVPYAQLQFASVATTHNALAQGDTTGGINGNLSRTKFVIGADLAIAPAEKVLIQPGVGFAITTATVSGTPTGAANSMKTVEDGNRLQPYYGFAAEAAALDWLDLRLGARQTIDRLRHHNTLALPETNESQVTETTTTVTTGIGVKLRSWTIDVNMNPLWFNNGPFLATGNATAGWGLDFAAKYEW